MADFAQIKIDTMNDIANAIIEKGGADGPMYPREMAAGIRSLAASSGGGEGGVALAPCVVILRPSTYSSGSATIGGIKIETTSVAVNFIINNETVKVCSPAYGGSEIVFIIYVPIDDPYANTTQIFCSGQCLKYDTLITMADGTRKEIAYLNVGDKVLSLNPTTNEFEEDTVFATDAFMKKFGDDKDVWTFSDGSTITTIHPHEFYSVDDQKFKYIANFNIGERLLKLVDGKLVEVKLEKHENIVEKTPHATLFTQKNNIYFANGILTGNRNSAKLSIRG